MTKSQYTNIFYNAFDIIFIVFSFHDQDRNKGIKHRKTLFVSRRLKKHFLICLLNSPLFLHIKERLIN